MMEPSAIWTLGILIGAVGSWAVALAIYGIRRLWLWAAAVNSKLGGLDWEFEQVRLRLDGKIVRHLKEKHNEGSRSIEEKHTT